MADRAFVGDFGAALGERRPVDGLPGLSPGLRARLAQTGFRTYSDAARRSLLELASSSARQSLEAFARRGTFEIDAVVLATASIWQAGSLRAADYSAWLSGLGLGHARLVPVIFPSCHNTSSMLDVTLEALSAGSHHSLLLVSADVADPEERVLDDGLAILSDGAASCVVTHARSGFEVVLHRSGRCHALVRYAGAPNGAFKKSLAMLTEIKSALGALLSDAGLSADVRIRVASNHYNNGFFELLSEMLGDYRLDFGAMMRNLPALSHVFSADPLLDLRDIASDPDVPEGAMALALHLGDYGWGLTLLRKVTA